MTDEQCYAELVELAREAALLNSCSSLLQWEEQTYMPKGGVEHRGNQIELLARMVHERRTNPRIGESLGRLEQSGFGSDSDSPAAVNIREWRRQFDRATKLPPALVAEIAKTTSLAQHHWAVSKNASRFSDFAPWLDKVLHLKRQEADCLNAPGGRYDALLDEYEAGATVAQLRVVFDAVKQPLADLVAKISSSPRKVDSKLLKGNFPIDRQKVFGQLASATLGFDFERGRLDETPHPFCSTIGPGDCRITTRYAANDFGDAFFSTLHETGHALYEQGLEVEHFGTPMGEAVSLGVHESQSRLWENLVGRGRGFWTYFWPIAKRLFPEALGTADFDGFLASANAVAPSLIRVDADQVTYNLHVLIRFELEIDLLAGNLAVADLPAAWNGKYRQLVGVEPKSDREGCLQDVHWSAGLVGYFPTYTLGNVFAAQLFEAATEELGDLNSTFSQGDFSPLLTWLRTNVHRHGSRYRSSTLVRKITGFLPDPKILLNRLEKTAEEFLL